MKITKKIGARRWETMETYMVEDVNNATDKELIQFCDPNSFGGYVTRLSNNRAMVEVNID